MKNKAQLLAAKTDIDAAIKKYGFASVRYVLNKRAQQARLERQLENEKKHLASRIEQIQKKLENT